MPDRRAATLCSVRVDFSSMESALTEVEEAASEGRGVGVHFVNAYTLSLADVDDEYAGMLREGELNLPDGRPLVWAARRAGVSDAAQVCGPDFMLHAFEHGSRLRHYLYGASLETLARLEASLRRQFPRSVIAGAESPPFRPLSPEEESEVVERIHASGANVTWVGLGTPKQDVFVERFKDRLSMPLVAVGAAFDFHAGVKSRPPEWVSRAGLEWLHRLASEPRRLGRRYVVGNWGFLRGLVRDGVRVHG